MRVDSEATLKILIVDDSEDDRDVFERLLRQDSKVSEIRTAEIGNEGVELFRTMQPDCVLLDYNLPGQDGLEIMEAIKGIDHYASIVMLTGQGSENVAVAALKAGASDYVVKDSISSVGLRRAVNNAIDKTRLQRKIDSQQEEQKLFVKTLLHDARAPLRHISTFSEFLDEDTDAGDHSNIKEYTSDIRIATKRIEDLLDTLASYALSESEVTFEPVCMNDVIRAVLDNLADRIQSRQAVIRHETLPTITGHKPQLIQLLQNLVGNGIKYCEAGQPAVEITVMASDQDDKVLFKVQDNGIGVPEDKLAIHPGPEPDIIQLIGRGKGHQPRADRAGTIEVLALGDVEFRMAHPVAERALIAKRERNDMAECISLFDMPPSLADDHRNFALIVKLVGSIWADQRLLMAGEGAGETDKERHIRRRFLPVFIFSIAIREVHADADDLFRRRQRDLVSVAAILMGDRPAFGGLLQLTKTVSFDDFTQGRPVRKKRRQGDHAVISDGTVIGPAV